MKMCMNPVPPSANVLLQHGNAISILFLKMVTLITEHNQQKTVVRFDISYCSCFFIVHLFSLIVLVKSALVLAPQYLVVVSAEPYTEQL